jgi:transposase, IS30 family
MGRHYEQLNDWERTRIMVLKAQERSIRAIGRILRRSPSTISRELQRNGHGGMYSAAGASLRVPLRRSAKPRRLTWQGDRLSNYVAAKLKKGWSPQSIAGKLARMVGKDSDYYVSHETIYASIYALPRCSLRKELIKALRQSHKTRRPRARGKDRRGQIPDLRPISERPQEVQGRLVPGHWEGDLIKGKGNKSAIGTLVERTSRYVILVKLEDATSPVVTGGFIREMMPVPEHLRHTLTYDRGREMTHHKHVSESLNLDVYFADPHAPWQRGSNEHINGQLRYWLPKGIDLRPYSQADLNHIADLINGKPRKILNWQSPKEVFTKLARNPIPSSGVALHS